jgi:prepilin-type N-terminal cleavage/methylation domain-containing protein
MKKLVCPRTRAFTLTEIMVVSAIFGLVMAGVLPFFIMNLQIQYVAEQKLLINGDIREVTNQMVENAREANSFVIYQAFAQQPRWDSTAANPVTETRDANGSGTVTLADRLQNGESGDFLVLVYYRDPYYDVRLYDGVATNNPQLSGGQVTRLVGYWVAPNRGRPGETPSVNAVYRFDTDTYKPAGATSWTTTWGATFPATLSDSGATGTTTIEALLPPATAAWANAAEFPLMLNNVNGLSNRYNFYNYQNKSVITRAKIVHGNRAKRVTNTYNFTITPRG